MLDRALDDDVVDIAPVARASAVEGSSATRARAMSFLTRLARRAMAETASTASEVPRGTSSTLPRTYDAAIEAGGAMDRKARDLASGKKKLEEYKRKKQAKGAALRAQLDHDEIAESAHEGPARGAPPSPARSEATSDLTRNKYQDRLEARLASVLGNKTNAGVALDAPDDAERGRLYERREKAIVAGRKLSDELAAARADIAAANDLTAYAARSPASTPGRDRDVPRAALANTPGREAAVDQGSLELRDRLRAEHAEVSRLRGELSALHAVEQEREAEAQRLVVA